MSRAFLLLWLFASVLHAAGPSRPPAPRFPVGKDTTFYDGPRDADGYIDYATAINRQMSQKLRPADNAAILLWHAMGPAPESAPVSDEHFTALGMKPPPIKGDYFISLHSLAIDRWGIKGKQFDRLYEEQSTATARPWQAKDLPRIAEWLKANEKPLTVVHQAATRPRYFTPLVVSTHNGKRGDLIGALLPSVQKNREFASALTARAMLHTSKGQLDEAWRDLLACHRLGRLVQQGNTLIEALVGYSIEGIAHKATLAFLDATKPDTKRLTRYQADLQKLPPLADLRDKISHVERCMFLDTVQMLHREGLGHLETLSDGRGRQAWSLERTFSRFAIDYTSIMREGNKWYARLDEAGRLPTREARLKAFDAIDRDIKTLRTEVTSPLKGGLLGLRAETSRRIGYILVGLLMPALGKVYDALDRTAQNHDNLIVALALERYHRDHKAYPKSLDNLAPKYLPRLPGDRFSDKPLLYRPHDKGYLLYSVGPNGKDDGGKGPDDLLDDLVVQMPLAPLKK